MPPLTFAVDTTSPGTISATASETVPPTPNVDNVTVNVGVTVKSTGGDVVFRAGDNVVLQSGSLVKSDTGNVTLTAGFGDNDGEAAIALNGSVFGSTVDLEPLGAGGIPHTPR